MSVVHALCVFFLLLFPKILLEVCEFLSAGRDGRTHTVPSSGLSLELLKEATKIIKLQ